MRSKTILLLLLLKVVAVNSQNEAQGIRFEHQLSWQALKEKAKTENKYIFMDCFATWCGPCKKMDKEVFVNDSVASYFNEKFICVKVQMDKTRNDDAFIQGWYNDADSIIIKYRIEGFPTFIFMSPQGEIVQRDLGYKSVCELIALGQSATQPNKVYVDPYARYDHLVSEYKQGIKHYDSMPYMIQVAYRFQDNDFAKKLLDEHTDYEANLPPEERYTKENVEFWSSFALSSGKKRFWFFYDDAAVINKVMKRKGYAESIVDRTIQNEIVNPFYEEQTNGSGVMKDGLMLNSPNLKADYSEADWKKLYNIVNLQYNAYYAERNVMIAKLNWYKKHNNYPALAKCFLLKLEKYGLDLTDTQVQGDLNSNAWDFFLNLTDTGLLNKIIPWMQKLLKETPTWTDALDTYANLLYKGGQKNEALIWEAKALNTSIALNESKQNVETFAKVIQQMINGEPTYVKRGAIWKVKN